MKMSGIHMCLVNLTIPRMVYGNHIDIEKKKYLVNQTFDKSGSERGI